MVVYDTSVIIDYLRRGKLAELSNGAITIITLLEILRGVRGKDDREKLKKSLKKLFTILPLNEDAVQKYCELYINLKSRGKMIPEADLIIASICTAFGEVLVTKNRHFQELKNLGLKVILIE